MVSKRPALTVRPVTAKRRGGEVARALLLFGGEATHRFLYRGLRPHGKSYEAFHELGEVLADEHLGELLLELGLVVVE